MVVRHKFHFCIVTRSGSSQPSAIGLLGLIVLSELHLQLSLPRDNFFPCRRGACAMNGFEAKSLDEDAFGEKASQSGLKTFDAFREYMLLIRNTAPKHTFTCHFLSSSLAAKCMA